MPRRFSRSTRRLILLLAGMPAALLVFAVLYKWIGWAACLIFLRSSFVR